MSEGAEGAGKKLGEDERLAKEYLESYGFSFALQGGLKGQSITRVCMYQGREVFVLPALQLGENPLRRYLILLHQSAIQRLVQAQSELAQSQGFVELAGHLLREQ